MLNDKKSIYYGIVMLFISKLLLDIVSILFYLLIGYLDFNILIVPISQCLFTILLLLYFFRLKVFPKIKIFHFISIIILTAILANISSSQLFLEKYSIVEKAKYNTFMIAINTFFFYSFAIIAYIKYLKISKE